MDKKLIYYTHSGLFHCDEVTGFAICYLARICDDFERLTDITTLPTDGIISDIGREYSPEQLKFDHHQGFLTRKNGYPYASAGLLWKEFGRRCCKTLGIIDNVEKICEWVDVHFIQSIDAHDADNKYEVVGTCSAGEVDIMTLPNTISKLNGKDVKNHFAQQEQFGLAANLIGDLLVNAIENAESYIQNKKEFVNIATIMDKVIILDKAIMWKEIVHEMYPDILFVIHKSNHPGNPYCMIAVSKTPTSRELKINIERPDWFKGFIHQSKWIAGGDSVETLIKLAQYNLNLCTK